MDITKIKQKLLALDSKKAIQFIVLFGSVAQGKNNQLSDIDIAVYYQGNKKERFAFRMKALGEFSDIIDLQIFQDLPLYVQKEVLKGKVMYYKDYNFTFTEFMRVIKDFGHFEKYLKDYYHAVAGVASG